MQQCESTLFQLTDWAPPWLASSLGPMFGRSGSPRNAVIAARVVGVRRFLAQDSWGPLGAASGTQQRVRRLREWADSRTADPVARVRRVAEGVREVLEQPRPTQLSGLLCYVGLWRAYHERDFQRWTRRQSSRRWLPTDGSEWSWVASCTTATASVHLLRLLGGGMRGPAGAGSRPFGRLMATGATLAESLLLPSAGGRSPLNTRHWAGVAGVSQGRTTLRSGGATAPASTMTGQLHRPFQGTCATSPTTLLRMAAVLFAGMAKRVRSISSPGAQRSFWRGAPLGVRAGPLTQGAPFAALAPRP